ncbi:hypothetical protein HN958_02595 [Candidatus Falkowbacteria bacterium]|nr:hypothetical protein [Candidatus Falkowbacteria bacterium]
MLGQIAKLHRLLQQEGLSEEAIGWATNEPGFRKDLVHFWQNKASLQPGSVRASSFPKVTPAEVSLADVLEKATSLHKALEESGLTQKDLQFAIENSLFRRRLVHFWMNKGKVAVNPFDFRESPEHQRARNIMGDRFFGIPEVHQALGCEIIQSQIEALAEIPFTDATLQECSTTHVLVADFGTSLNQLSQKAHGSGLNEDSSALVSGRNSRVDNEKGEIGWRLIGTGVVRSSMLERQGHTLPPKSFSPELRELVYATLLSLLVRGGGQFDEISFIPFELVESHSVYVYYCNLAEYVEDCLYWHFVNDADYKVRTYPDHNGYAYGRRPDKEQ